MTCAAPAPFLGVAASLTGRRWTGPSADVSRAADMLARMTGLAPPLCTLLAQRGVAPEAATAFLAPRLKDLLPDPRTLRDMDAAAARLVAAVTRGERVAVFADYDVDGACSAALAIRWLRAAGARPSLYVPDRIDEGYGPNVPAMQELAAGHDLIVCVDCGTLAHEPIAAVTGTDVIVIDHHLGGETLPPAHSVVNPNRADEDGALGHLCAAGVVFLCLVEANRQLRAAGRPGPDLMALVDLVALATVADVVPLTGVNRAFVHRGLKAMAGAARVGIAALAAEANLAGPPEAHHLGFVLGPRINAGGRVGRADLGARLLATDDAAEAAALAADLERLNAARRQVEAEVRDAALAQADARGMEAPLVWAAGDGWHPGVVGIVAARLKEATNRPAVVIGFDGDAGKGSGRSIAGIDLGAAIQRLAHEGLLEKGGGHRMAAGLSLTRAQLAPAMERLADLLASQGEMPRGAGDLRIDVVLSPSAADCDLIDRLGAAGPFGAAAPAPRFALAEATVMRTWRVGDRHLKLALSDGTGPALDAIAFGAFDGPLGPALEARAGRRAHIAGRLEINRWNGRARPQLRIEDAAVP